MDKFEVGAGLVMKNAWNHSEAMQITDLNVLINHVADVLQFAIDSPEHMRVGHLTPLTAGLIEDREHAAVSTS
jgi:hypothetical protein